MQGRGSSHALTRRLRGTSRDEFPGDMHAPLTTRWWHSCLGRGALRGSGSDTWLSSLSRWLFRDASEVPAFDDNADLAAMEGDVRIFAGDGPLPLQCRRVSWLDGDDAEVDGLQRLLNDGQHGAEVLLGAEVVEDYFAKQRTGTQSSGSKRTCDDCSSVDCHPPLASLERSSSASTMTPLPSAMTDSNLDTLIGGSSGPEIGQSSTPVDASTNQMETQTDMSFSVFKGLRKVLQDVSEALDHLRAHFQEDTRRQMTTGEVLEKMQREVHAVTCSGCECTIVGPRMRCSTCCSMSFCEDCFGAAAAKHNEQFPDHAFSRVILPPLRCLKGHQVLPGLIRGEKNRELYCCSCDGPLTNGVVQSSDAPQYRCSEPSCGFALCGSCYCLNRQRLAQDPPATHPRTVECQKSTSAAATSTTTEHEDEIGAHEDYPPNLQCQFLFSSPLCCGKAVRVETLLHCGIDETPSEVSFGSSVVEHEVLHLWGLSFNASMPSVVETVRSGGWVSLSNSRAESEENMVREGDTLVQLLSIDGAITWVNGRDPAAVLKEFIASMPSSILGGTPLHLVFCGLRGLRQLNIKAEIQELEDTGYELMPRAATTENIRTLVAAGQCSMLHFSFHTSSDESRRIYLEDSCGKAHVLTAQEFQALLTEGQMEQRIRLVFLSSCHSWSLGTLVAEAGVRHVICVNERERVYDNSCRLFAKHFFVALGAGSSVRKAFDCGVEALRFNSNEKVQEDAYKFMLLPENAPHSEVMVLAKQVAKKSSSASLPAVSDTGSSWGALPAQVEDFVGREVDMYKLLFLLCGRSNRRFVEVHGEGGIGKASLMVATGHFALLRRAQFEEVRFLCLPRCRSKGKEGTHTRDQAMIEEIRTGLRDLRHRVASSPRMRVLLLLRGPEAFFLDEVQCLLGCPNVHMVWSIASATAETITDVGARVSAAGAKPTPFDLGPLQPLAQAKLFLQRAGRSVSVREVRTGELEGEWWERRGPSWYARQPVDFLALASSKLLTPLGGNPRRIVQAARALRAPSAAASQPLIESSGCERLPDIAIEKVGDESHMAPVTKEVGTECSPASSTKMSKEVATPSMPSMCARVRLEFPDGPPQNEWVPRALSLEAVLAKHAPDVAPESVDIFVEDFRAQPDILVDQLAAPLQDGCLVLQMRRKEDLNC